MLSFLNYFVAAVTPGDADFKEIGDVINELFRSMWAPLLGVAVGLSLLLALWLGLKFWTAGGDEAKQKKAKESVKYFVIGIVVIFIIAGLTPVLVSAFRAWAKI